MKIEWKGELVIAMRAALVTLAVTGLAYPLLVTGAAQLLFSSEANGSMVRSASGNTVGSSLIGQPFHRAAYVQGRPSAAGEQGWDAAASSGSNLATTSRKLRERVQADAARLARENPNAVGPVPLDLLTASASGLDPHISPEAARWQVPRVAAARGVAPERVAQVVESAIEGRELGLFGEPRVNVVLLNLALDNTFGPPPP